MGDNGIVVIKEENDSGLVIERPTQVEDADIKLTHFIKPGMASAGVQVFGLIKEKRQRLSRAGFKRFPYHLPPFKTKEASSQDGVNLQSRTALNPDRTVREMGIQVSSYRNHIESDVDPKIPQRHSSLYGGNAEEKRKEQIKEGFAAIGSAVIEINSFLYAECDKCIPGRYSDRDEYVFERTHRKELHADELTIMPEHPCKTETESEDDISGESSNSDSDSNMSSDYSTDCSLLSDNSDLVECDDCKLRSNIRESVETIGRKLIHLKNLSLS